MLIELVSLSRVSRLCQLYKCVTALRTFCIGLGRTIHHQFVFVCAVWQWALIIFIVDPRGLFVMFNDAWRAWRVEMQPAEEFSGTPEKWKNLIKLLFVDQAEILWEHILCPVRSLHSRKTCTDLHSCWRWRNNDYYSCNRVRCTILYIA